MNIPEVGSKWIIENQRIDVDTKQPLPPINMLVEVTIVQEEEVRRGLSHDGKSVVEHPVQPRVSFVYLESDAATELDLVGVTGGMPLGQWVHTAKRA